MKKFILSLFLILMFAPSISAMGYKEAMKQDKPIVLYINMFGCSACRHFESFYNAAQSKFPFKFNFVKEDINDSEVGAKLNVNEAPSVYILEPKNRTASKIKYDCLRDQSCFEQTLLDYGQK